MVKSVFGWLLATAIASGVVTGAGRVRASAARSGSDPRLKAMLRLRLTQLPLGDLCWVIEKRSGIPHRVADTAAGDLLVAVNGEMSVEQLQRALTATLGLVWTPASRREGGVRSAA